MQEQVKPQPNPSGLAGLKAVTFESRMALPAARLIEKFGGTALMAPTMKEVPLENLDHLYDFFEKLKAREFDLLIVLTGVALRATLKALEKKYTKEEILATFRQTPLFVRGPKPLAVCRQNNIPVLAEAPEPNTWREIVHFIKSHSKIPKGRTALLEYGISNSELIHDLTDIGLTIQPVQVYEWKLPDDLGPLQTAIQSIIEGQIDLVFFTSANQVDHLFKVVIEANLEAAFRRAMQAVAIYSIGPVCSERLVHFQLFPDYETSPNKLNDLMEQAASTAQQICASKKARTHRSWVRVLESPPNFELDTLALDQSYFLKACRREVVKKIPIWLMRQAGRYMAEYQMIRQKVDFLTLCRTPELASEATVSALERLGVDAAIIFSDILIPLTPMGLKLHFSERIGPLIDNPLRHCDDFNKLNFSDINSQCGFLFEAIRQVRSSIKSHIPLIGFCGAPFTLASYMIEGRSSRNFIPTKVMMHDEPKLWDSLMQNLTTVLAHYLNAQIEAGCQAVQIFDSWVGHLDEATYRACVLPYTKELVSRITKNVPVIYFGTHTQHLFGAMTETDCSVMGVDATTNITKVADVYGARLAFQGNLDPTLLFCDKKTIRNKTIELLDQVGNKPGYIFNLGHGILPETPVDHVLSLIDVINEWSASHL